MKKALQSFLKSEREKSFSLIDELEELNLDSKSQVKLKKVLEIMLVGELYGLHTLSEILSTFHITSNNLQKIWQGFNFNQIRIFCLNYCEDLFSEELIKIAKKSDSTWSRKRLTIVIDDSIFKQWLQNMPHGEFFAKFFSGQTHSTVYGFRVTLIGVALGKDFYPLYFQLSTKDDSTKKVALNLLKKVRRLFKQIADNEKIVFPNLFLSVDSGFTDEELIKYCRRTGITFIGVPKKSCLFTIGRCRMNLTKYISKVFLKKEQEYLKQCQKVGKEIEPFLLRKKAYFQALDKMVILIFFRLKNSKKVTVIYTENLEIQAKTLRRRFFQRTQIEQFFRMLKDTLKIQKSKNTDMESFIKKLSIFIIKAFVCQKFKNYCNKKFEIFKEWSFTKLRHHIIYGEVDKSILESLVKSKGFCNV